MYIFKSWFLTQAHDFRKFYCEVHIQIHKWLNILPIVTTDSI